MKKCLSPKIIVEQINLEDVILSSIGISDTAHDIGDSNNIFDEDF